MGRGQLAHLLEKHEVAALRDGHRIGTLEDFDKTQYAAAAVQRMNHQELARRIPTAVDIGRSRKRWDKLPLICGDHIFKEAMMCS